MSIEKAKKVLMLESKAIANIAKKINKDFIKAIDLVLKTKGRVILTGMGKPGFIAQKISATMSSTGTPSLYLHPAEAVHGDLGRVTKDDIIIAISNSGETEEIIKLIPILKKIGSKIIAITGNKKSTLGKNSDYILDSSVEKEACPMGLAPTTSTTAMLALGDAFAVVLLEKKKFKPKDFALYHPGGALGKRLLLTVKDIMRPKSQIAIVNKDMRIKDVLIKITKMKTGSASVIDKTKKLIGIFTDGDLRRHIKGKENILDKKVQDLMTKDPITITPDKMAAEAFKIITGKTIDEIPVVDNKKNIVGLLDVQDILKAGLV